MRKLNKKYNQIIETAKTLFWKHGIRRVTIEEICKVANVSKMTFYKHFSNKNELIKQLLIYVGETATEKYSQLLNSEMSYPEKVKKMIKLKMEQTDDITQEFINDYYSLEDPDLIAFQQESIQKVLEESVKDIIRAQDKGDVRKDIKPEFVLYFLNHMTEMATDPKLTPHYSSGQELIMELMNFFFYGILPRKEEASK